MGACVRTLRIAGDCDHAVIKLRVSRVVDAAKRENGYSPYSGSWAAKSAYDLQFVPGVFADEDEAREHSEGHADRWGPTLVYRVQPKGKAPYWFLFALCAS